MARKREKFVLVAKMEATLIDSRSVLFGLIKMQPHTCDYHFSQIVIEGQEPALFY
jgi:hypothetical protein